MTAMKKIKLSPTQLNVFHTLKEGGRIYYFHDDGSVGLDDADGNTLSFSWTTFKFLLKNDIIECYERPTIDCELYTIASHFEL